MVHAALFPSFGVDLRPFHHSVAAKGSVRNFGSPAFRFFRVVVRIQIMVYNAGISQHTRTGHEFLARGKVPVPIAETAAEIHLGRREIRVVSIVRIRNTSARAAGRLDKIVTKQIIPLFRGYACAVGFASVIGSGAGVGER